MKTVYLAVDGDGQENLFTVNPHRHFNGVCVCNLWTTRGNGFKRPLALGTIEKLIRRKTNI